MSYQQAVHIKPEKTLNIDVTSKKDTQKTARRVDINDLFFRIREKKKLQRKENLLFFSLVASIIVITGIIASL